MIDIHFKRAIVRRPDERIGDGITTADLGAPDPVLALRQHGAYVQHFQDQGIDVVELDPLPDYPDGHFVEDTAVIFPDFAVLARPGADRRRGEAAEIEPELHRFREVVEPIEPPGTLDGGDVLRIGRRLFIGLSARTNREGARQLGRIVARHGYDWECIDVGAGLHLKSSVNVAAEETVLVTRELAEHSSFLPFRRIVVPEGEEYAANVLCVGNTLLVPNRFPRTRGALEDAGLATAAIGMSEFRKMDGGLTCLSLRF